ncbi:histidinol-phosphate transaminase [bacterium]|nr:histidinol-phosphate transaminase [bacterium]
MTNIKIKPWISSLPEYIPGGTIEEIKEKYNLKEVYKLASNENIYGPSPKIIEYFKNGFSDIKYYPDSYCRQLRKKLSRKLGVSGDSIIFGNGTDQIIEMVCDAILCKNSNVIVPDPTFLTYEKSALKNEAEVIKVPLKNFRQDIKSIIKSINKDTAVIFLTSPHNPTGTIITKEEIECALENIRKDILVVLDEAYIEFVPEKYKVDSLKYLKQYDNLLIMRTFSKIYGIAGLRIGYGIGSSEVISNITKLMQPFVVNSIAQVAAILSLEDDDNISRNVDTIIKEREIFSRRLKQEGIQFVESYSNFILIKAGGRSTKIIEELMKKGFMVRGGEFLGFPGYIRVSISLPEINKMFTELFINLYREYNS